MAHNEVIFDYLAIIWSNITLLVFKKVNVQFRDMI